jgi:hypothetical protein
MNLKVTQLTIVVVLQHWSLENRRHRRQTLLAVFRGLHSNHVTQNAYVQPAGHWIERRVNVSAAFSFAVNCFTRARGGQPTLNAVWWAGKGRLNR